jgi:hypothetical protein
VSAEQMEIARLRAELARGACRPLR